MFSFDTKNPFGYLCACSLQYVHLAYEAYFVSNLSTLGIGAFLFAMAAIKDLKRILRSTDAQCAQCETEENWIKALNQIREFVQMHSAVKQLCKVNVKIALKLNFIILRVLSDSQKRITVSQYTSIARIYVVKCHYPHIYASHFNYLFTF